MFFGYERDNSKAFAAFDKDLIIQCCENYAAAREARIQQDIERAIAREMEPYSPGWFKRHFMKFRGAAKTREEALERIKEDPKEFLEVSIWDRIHDRGSSMFASVNRIKTMAQNSAMPYVVLSDEGQFILNYKDKK